MTSIAWKGRVIVTEHRSNGCPMQLCDFCDFTETNVDLLMEQMNGFTQNLVRERFNKAGSLDQFLAAGHIISFTTTITRKGAVRG